MPLETPRLSYVAVTQLAAWQEIARGLKLDIIPEVHARCGLPGCGQSVVPLEFNGKEYRYTGEQLLALTVAHLRQAHMDLDPDR